MKRATQETSTPTSPASHIKGLDPSVERVILRCLEREPRMRPAGALAVAAALPGGDPLAVAFGGFLFVLLRFGLLSGLSWVPFMFVGSDVVLTADMSSWHAGRSLFALLLVSAIAVYSFYLCLAGRPLTKSEVLDP